MKYTKHDIDMSAFQKRRGQIFIWLYTYNVKLPFSQGVANWYHDAFSIIYDRVVPILVPKYYEIIKMIADEYVPDNSMVLDLCCGTGNITFAAARKAREVIGLDAAEGMLSKARKKALKMGVGNVKFVYADVTARLDFDDGTFDVVTAGFSAPTNVPLFQGKNKDIIREVYRILKSGGSLVLLEGRHEITDMYLSQNEYQELLSDAGFDNIELKNVNDVYAIVSAKK